MREKRGPSCLGSDSFSGFEPQRDCPLNMMRRVSFLSTRPEILSAENIAKVRNRLSSLGALSQSLKQCLDHAMLKFSLEDSSLQGNARLIILCEGKKIEFVSGNGESRIKVSVDQGNPCYEVELSSFGNTVRKCDCGRLLLSVENLEKVAAEMIFWREMTKGLKESLKIARDHFSQEAVQVQQNCRLVVQRDGRKIEFISGKGHNFICVSDTWNGKCDKFTLPPREEEASPPYSGHPKRQ